MEVVTGQGLFINEFITFGGIETRAVDRILKSRIKSNLKSRIKSDLSDFLTGRKPLLVGYFKMRPTYVGPLVPEL